MLKWIQASQSLWEGGISFIRPPDTAGAERNASRYIRSSSHLDLLKLGKIRQMK